MLRKVAITGLIMFVSPGSMLQVSALSLSFVRCAANGAMRWTELFGAGSLQLVVALACSLGFGFASAWSATESIAKGGLTTPTSGQPPAGATDLTVG